MFNREGVLELCWNHGTGGLFPILCFPFYVYHIACWILFRISSLKSTSLDLFGSWIDLDTSQSPTPISRATSPATTSPTVASATSLSP
jgi:hypothetical protein